MNQRAAGILLPIFSLPGDFGIGDLGPEAFAFAKFLNRAGQRYWQILPLNPASAGQGYSPYSSVSAFAGYKNLISPEGLVSAGYLTKNMIRKFRLPNSSNVDYNLVDKTKDAINALAYQNFCHGKFNVAKRKFNAFCRRENKWLDDYALYVVLAEKYSCDWVNWPAKYKDRDRASLKAFRDSTKNEILKTKWIQFIFFQQYHALKTHCHKLGIFLLGDLPYYVSYGSADVWANRDLFNIKKDGTLLSVAGVPPDYFNKDGQRWGMPTYRWDEIKQTKYKWWTLRMAKNLELYDLVRLDHFRAFAAYWDVPAVEKTAKRGMWKRGPLADLFIHLKKKLGSLPFVAEDLGYITPDVSALKDQFAFPGMKVLQFAFGGDVSKSVEAPHNYSSTNYFVYTGTHDNNTTRGWFAKELGKSGQQNLSAYIGKKISKQNVNETLIGLAYATVANVAIIPMQDILDLDGKARMNLPSSSKGNWLWRLTARQISKSKAIELRELGNIYNRVAL